MNPRLPKEGALDGVLSRNPDPPTMHAGMPRDPDLLARLKRMHEAKMKAKEEEDFDPETAKYGINNLDIENMLKGWEEDWDKAMLEIDNTPSDMCKLCKKDMNDPANLAPYQHEAMLETGAFPDYCIHCQKEHGLPGDF